MSFNEKEALMALSLILRPGTPILQFLLDKYEDPVKLYYAICENTDKQIPHQITAAAKAFDVSLVQQITDYCSNSGIKMIFRGDADYPVNLENIDCPPLMFYCAGDSSVLQNDSALTIVGARKATDYSKKISANFASRIAEKGHPIISGFAKGIDSAAHWGAINAGGKTVAVLGCGFDYDYPRGNRELRNNIVRNGAVISEYPPLERPAPEYFTIRNRMIAGLAEAVLVVQASDKSGSINTATHALMQGKEIFVIPPCDIFSEEYKGQSSLIRDGGIPVFGPNDILTEL